MGAAQILIPIIPPVWIYLWFMNKQVSCYLGLGKTIQTNKLHNSIFLCVSSQDNTKLWLCYFYDDAAIIDLKSFAFKLTYFCRYTVCPKALVGFSVHLEGEENKNK